ncbi:MAG TPA: c-type cytochrome [Bacteroidota bacterium]|nr:c-type cytochrome [Bacteroidota bacterium]
MSLSFVVIALMLLQSGQPAQQPQQRERNKHALAIEESIKGRENEPAETVFKNIQMFKGMPAGRVLRVMEGAYTNALGVSCDHCHVEGKWESDDKRPKQVARKMAAMMRDLNQTVKAATGKDDATVNCVTCHRGDTKPALNLPGMLRRSGG